jgi:hypothetical protein
MLPRKIFTIALVLLVRECTALKDESSEQVDDSFYDSRGEK